MATNENNQEQNAIDALDFQLTAAGQRVASNKKIIYWCIAIVVICAAAGAAWYWGYILPTNKNSWKAYNQVEVQAANDSIASAEYAKVADKYGRSDAGNLAALQAALSYYNLKKYDETIKYLKKFSTKEDVMQAHADMLMGDAYVNLKKYDEAIAAYNSALRISSGNEQIAPAILWKQANVYDAQKKYKEALGCFKQIKQAFPNFRFGNGMSVDAYIAREEARIGQK
ncbi:MAG: tetratricopeptide repeat protein [Bacteroides sp.]|nr:tetratricopeptide repeat protein [Bacteroides sp.]MBD5371084.1 tetratricopeptide repeat protein [Bacteroides sp.]